MQVDARWTEANIVPRYLGFLPEYNRSSQIFSYAHRFLGFLSWGWKVQALSSMNPLSCLSVSSNLTRCY